MRRFSAFLLACGLALASIAAMAADREEAPMRVAVVPYLTPSVLLTLFHPLRQHLEQELQHPVELYTAPDIRTHIRRITRPDYDAVITAAHMGRLAQLDAGYVPLAGFESPLKGVITVRGDSQIRKISDLKGHAVAVNDRLVLVSMVTLSDLQKNGIALAEMKLVPAVTQNSALLSVANGDVDAAITAQFTLTQISEAQRQSVRIIYTTDQLPNVMFLASARLGAARQERLKQALLSFGQTAAGKKFFASSGFSGIAPLNEQYMKRIDTYLPETRRILASER